MKYFYGVASMFYGCFYYSQNISLIKYTFSYDQKTKKHFLNVWKYIDVLTPVFIIPSGLVRFIF